MEKMGVVMIRIALLAACACIFGSSVAMAEGLGEVGEACCDWRGFYFGGYVGAGQGDASSTFTDLQTQTFRQTVPGTTVTQTFTDNGSGTLSGEVSGAQADLIVGYNLPLGSRFLVGIQGEGTPWSTYTLETRGQRTSKQRQTTTTNVGGVITVTTASATATSTFELNDELDSMVAFVGRAGVLVSPNVLIYGIGGVVAGDFVVPDSENPRGGERETWETGYTVGGGGEVKLNCAWSLRAEYRFYHFDYDRSQSSTDSQTQVTGATTFTNENEFSRHSSTEVDLHTGKIGVVYRFCGILGNC